MSSSKVLVLGSGMAALGAAQAFRDAGVQCRLYDKNAFPGGHTASFLHDTGFIFDDGPHISFTRNARIQDLFAGNVLGKYEVIDAYVNNYYQGAWVKHPVQANLHNVPAELKARCILDFIAASQTELIAEPANYLEWLISAFGKTFATHFPAVYGKKYHTVEAEKMSTVWMGPRLYRPSMEEVIRGALFEETPNVHYVTHFRYPTTGGFEAYLKPFYAKSDIRLEHEVVEIDPQTRSVRFANGVSESYDHLVSSIPLPELVPMIKDVPDAVLLAAGQLVATSCITVNVGVARNDFTPAVWSYFYDEDICFARLSFPHKMSPETCPPGCGSIQAECYYSWKYRPMNCAPEEMIKPVIDDLVRVGLLREGEKILHADAKLIPYANVVFDLDRESALPVVKDWMKEIGIVSVGRFGEWGYHWTDESFVSGEHGARRILEQM